MTDDKKDRVNPSGQCVHCGKLIEAQTDPGDSVAPRDDFHRRYTRHVVEVHDKPATVLPGADK